MKQLSCRGNFITRKDRFPVFPMIHQWSLEYDLFWNDLSDDRQMSFSLISFLMPENMLHLIEETLYSCLVVSLPSFFSERGQAFSWTCCYNSHLLHFLDFRFHPLLLPSLQTVLPHSSFSKLDFPFFVSFLFSITSDTWLVDQYLRDFVVFEPDISSTFTFRENTSIENYIFKTMKVFKWQKMFLSCAQNFLCLQ